MTPLQMVFALLVGAGNAASISLAIFGKSWSWIVLIVSQVVNLTYLALTDQWLVWIGGQPVCLLLGVFGLWRWQRHGVHRDPSRKASAGDPPDTADPVAGSLIVGG